MSKLRDIVNNIDTAFAKVGLDIFELMTLVKKGGVLRDPLQLNAGTDLNSVDISGIYYFLDFGEDQNIPIGSDGSGVHLGILVVLNIPDIVHKQAVISMHENIVFLRTNNGAWRQV